MHAFYFLPIKLLMITYVYQLQAELVLRLYTVTLIAIVLRDNLNACIHNHSNSRLSSDIYHHIPSL